MNLAQTLINQNQLPLLKGGLRGIERECLRTDPIGNLAKSMHPHSLGATLTHPYITTDYAESLMEFITNTHMTAEDALQDLFNITQIVHNHLDNELLWAPSMPCVLPAEEQILIAEFGSSNSGKLKHTYRKGLALRYGKIMQCIAGIHYNLSFDPKLLAFLQQQLNSNLTAQDFQSQIYIDLMRSFIHYSWVLLYLFGASPVVDASFLQNIPNHNLQKLDKDSFYAPHATSLRMSKIGYKSSAQAGIIPCYNKLKTYIERIRSAITTPYSDYVAQGTHDKNGNWQQLNTNILQIENEYYSSIRPKRIPNKGETALSALATRGVQYVEVRCLDIDPFMPLGLDHNTANFIELFLTFCLLEQCKSLTTDECKASFANFEQVAINGKKPGLKLQYLGKSLLVTDFLKQLFDNLQPIAEMLDKANDCNKFTCALNLQYAKLTDQDLLSSSKVLHQITTQKISFKDFALQLSKQHQQIFKKTTINAELADKFNNLAIKSHTDKLQLEQQNDISFDQYVANYQKQFNLDQ